MPFFLPERDGRRERDPARACASSSSSAATTRSARRTCSTSSCGSAPATRTTTARTCSSPVGDEDGREFAVKPMNCPGACLVYASERHSYRDLPLRLAEFGLCTATSARACCTGCCACARSPRTTRTSSAPRSRSCPRCATSPRRSTSSTRCSASTTCASSCRRGPEKSIGTDEQWDAAERALAQALDEMGREYQVNPGDGAFYGPKIDFHITDALGRSWQCGTCQLDFFMPRALRPHLHRRRRHAAHAGDDPPRAARLDRALPRHPDRAPRRRVPGVARAGAGEGAADRRPPRRVRRSACERELRAAGVRAELDERSESVGRKIRDAELAKVPYMLVVGDKEEEARGRLRAPPRRGRLGLMPLARRCRSNPK